MAVLWEWCSGREVMVSAERQEWQEPRGALGRPRLDLGTAAELAGSPVLLILLQ